MAAQNKDSKNNANDVVKPVRTSEYDENRGSYMDANGNYVYTIWETFCELCFKRGGHACKIAK